MLSLKSAESGIILYDIIALHLFQTATVSRSFQEVD